MSVTHVACYCKHYEWLVYKSIPKSLQLQDFINPLQPIMTPFGLWTCFLYATNMGQHRLLHWIPSIVIAFTWRTYISGLLFTRSKLSSRTYLSPMQHATVSIMSRQCSIQSQLSLTSKDFIKCLYVCCVYNCSNTHSLLV